MCMMNMNRNNTLSKTKNHFKITETLEMMLAVEFIF